MSCAALIGVMTYGVHINGYTYSPDGKLMMWIGHRSKSKPTYPDMYDNMVSDVGCMLVNNLLFNYMFCFKFNILVVVFKIYLENKTLS